MPNNNNNNQKKDATLNDVVAALERNQESLDEISVWLKINGIEKIKNVLTSSLDTPEKKIVYHLSDGSTITEIEKKCSVSDSQVSRYQKKWHKLGLMKKTASRGRGDRHVKIFDLEDYGIEIPKITPKQETQQTATTTQPDTEDQSNAI